MKKPNILICGGGKSPDVDREFFRHVPENGKILLCSFASNNMAATNEFRIQWCAELAPNVTIDFVTMDNAESLNLNDYDALFITGGSTYLLQRRMYETGFINKIRDYAMSGGIVYGSSAGAMAMSADIGHSKPKDDPELLGNITTRGMDFLNGHCVAPHWPMCSDFAKQFARDTGYKLICLPENTCAWYYNDGKLSHTIGEGIEFID